MAKRMAIRIKVLDRSEYVEISEEMLSNYEIFIRHGKIFLRKFHSIGTTFIH